MIIILIMLDHKNITDKIEESISTKKKILSDKLIINKIQLASKLIIDCINNNGIIYFCGNGGSAADAQHLAAELLVRLRPNVNRKPLPGSSLAQDFSTLTACGNDFNFDDIFLRNFQALAKKNDLLFSISTSGNSKNVINVSKYAFEKNFPVISLTGNNGGKLIDYSTCNINIPSNTTARIQESHIMIGHIILETAEDSLI